MNVTTLQALVEMLAVLLIALGFLFWKYGPCGHDECRRIHARMAQLDREAEERRLHASHEAYFSACRLCNEDRDRGEQS